MIRITGGTFRGRNLQTIKGLKTRPTAARIRQSLFDILLNSKEGFPSFSEMRVLDLYAGTGAMGFEALSRGAIWVTFVDSSKRAVDCIRGNIGALEVGDLCRVVGARALDALRGMEINGEDFHLVILDPPYRALRERQRTLEVLGELSILSPGAVVLVEGPVEKRKEDNSMTNYASLHEIFVRRWGDTEVRFFRNE